MQTAKPAIDFYEAGNICGVLELDSSLMRIVHAPNSEAAF